jgi:hypothetical protein
MIPSLGVIVRLQKSTSPTHSGGLMIGPSCPLFNVPFAFHDDIESIGLEAFASCIFTNFRVPPLITEIPAGILYGCRSMFSVEIPDNTTEFQESAFGYCYWLRNVAFPPNAVFGDRFFVHEGPDKPTDLHRLFGSDLEIIRELMRRFDRLPIQISLLPIVSSGCASEANCCNNQWISDIMC